MTKRRRKKSGGTWIGGVVVFLTLCFIGSLWYVSENEKKLLSEQSKLVSFTYENPTHDYDWSYLKTKGSFMSYEDDKYTSRQGIDVSSHNGQIDWKKVRKSGVDFVIIREGYRGYQEGYAWNDTNFRQNIEGALENGLDVGVYFYSQAVTVEEAAEEADMVIKALKGYKITLPVVFDYELQDDGGGRISEISQEEKTRMAVTFMNRVKDAGYTPMVYASTSFFPVLFDLSYLNDYLFWVAQYDTPYPTYPYQFAVWQYSSTGSVKGINGNVDMNIMFVKK